MDFEWGSEPEVTPLAHLIKVIYDCVARKTALLASLWWSM